VPVRLSPNVGLVPDQKRGLNVGCPSADRELVCDWIWVPAHRPGAAITDPDDFVRSSWLRISIVDLHQQSKRMRKSQGSSPPDSYHRQSRRLFPTTTSPGRLWARLLFLAPKAKQEFKLTAVKAGSSEFIASFARSTRRELRRARSLAGPLAESSWQTQLLENRDAPKLSCPHRA